MTPKPLAHRLDALQILLRRGMPCVVWGEDALRFYGVPTCAFELFVLVADVDLATQYLREAGYAKRKPREWEPLPELMDGSSQVVQPLPKESASGSSCWGAVVALLPARSWHFKLEPDAFDAAPFPFPPLAPYVDSVIDVWLDAPMSIFATHIGCHLVYIYEHIKQVRDPDFVKKISPDHRDFHLESLIQPVSSAQRLKWKLHRDTFREGEILDTQQQNRLCSAKIEIFQTVESGRSSRLWKTASSQALQA